MNPPIQQSSNPAPPALTASLADLADAVDRAVSLGKQLAADQFHGASQFAAGIRSALDHANDLVALQKAWAANQSQTQTLKN